MRIRHSGKAAMCFCLAVAISGTCCASGIKNGSAENENGAAAETEKKEFLAEKVDPHLKAPRPAFSDRTVLVTMQDGLSDEDIRALAKDFNLDVKYIYSAGKSCALSSRESLSEKEMRSLVALLKADSRVFSAELDRIIYLDDREWKGFDREIM